MMIRLIYYYINYLLTLYLIVIILSHCNIPISAA